MTNQEKHDLSKIKRKENLDKIIPSVLKKEILELMYKFTANIYAREEKDYARIIEIDKYLSDNNAIVPELRTIVKSIQGKRKAVNGDCAAQSQRFMEEQIAKGYEFKTYNKSSTSRGI